MEAYQDMAEALHATDHPGQVVIDGVASYKACQQGYGKNANPAWTYESTGPFMVRSRKSERVHG